MAGYRAVTPNININTESGQLRTEILNTFNRLDGQLSSAPYRIGFTVGPVGNDTGSVNSTLAQQTVDYTTLTKRGSSILVYSSGITSPNANLKEIKLYIGNVEIFTTGSLAFNDIDWNIFAEIIRAGATSQVNTVVWNGSATLTNKITNTLTNVDLAETTYIKIVGIGTAANDIQLYHMKSVLIA